VSPKLNTLRLSENREKGKNMNPCMSLLGESHPPERELQVLHCFTHTSTASVNPKRSQNTPIQFANITLAIQQGTNAIQTPTITFHTIIVYTIHNSHHEHQFTGNFQYNSTQLPHPEFTPQTTQISLAINHQSHTIRPIIYNKGSTPLTWNM